MEISDFDLLVKGYIHLRGECDELKDKLSEKEIKRREVEAQLLSALDELGKSRWDIAGIGTISTVDKWSYKTPKTPEQKHLFFEYLKLKNVFEEIVSVNSQTLNAFAKREMEIARDEGKTDFSIPGLEEPTLYKTVSLRKG
jgi:hypothetical protein